MPFFGSQEDLKTTEKEETLSYVLWWVHKYDRFSLELSNILLYLPPHCNILQTGDDESSVFSLLYIARLSLSVYFYVVVCEQGRRIIEESKELYRIIRKGFDVIHIGASLWSWEDRERERDTDCSHSTQDTLNN